MTSPIDTIREALTYPIDVPVALAAINLIDEHFAAETGESYDQGFANGIKENARRRVAAEQRADDLADALLAVTERQPQTVEWLRANGIVFDGPLGTDPDNWQHVAFSIYNDLCEADSIARAALDRHTHQDAPTFICVICNEDLTAQVKRKAGSSRDMPRDVVAICQRGHYTQFKTDSLRHTHQDEAVT